MVHEPAGGPGGGGGGGVARLKVGAEAGAAGGDSVASVKAKFGAAAGSAPLGGVVGALGGAKRNRLTTLVPEQRTGPPLHSASATGEHSGCVAVTWRLRGGHLATGG